MTTYEQVESAFNTANSVSEAMMAGAEAVMNGMEIDDIELPDFDGVEEIDVDLESVTIDSTVPALSVNITVPDMPSEPSLDEAGEIETELPESENVDFNITIPEAPGVIIDSAPDSPGVSQISIPSMPDYEMPTSPTLDDITVPTAPVIELPDFTAVAPSFNIDDLPEVPGVDYTEEQYQSDIYAAMFQKIINDIANGGTGLDVDVEAAIYDRALARQQDENERLYREVEDQLTATGFELPSGAKAASLRAVATEISRKNDKANWEVAIDQAKLAQENTHFILELAEKVEAILRDFFNKQEARRLEAAKIVALQAVEVFNAQVNKFKTAMDIYKVEAEVFESKIRAKLAAVEIYRAQIDGTKALSDIQKARVDIYSAQISAVQAMMGIYATQMEAAKLESQVEIAKIEAFKAEIEAYVAKIEAQRARVGVFQVQVEAAKAQTQMAAEKVRAYGVKVDAAKAKVQAEQAKIQAVIETNKGKVEVYTAQIQAAKAQADVNIAIAQADIEVFKGEVQQNIAIIDAQKKIADMRIAEASFNVEVQKARAQVAIEEIRATADAYTTAAQVMVQGKSAQIQGYSNMASAALNVISAGVSLSGGYNDTTSKSDDMSEVHNFYET